MYLIVWTKKKCRKLSIKRDNCYLFCLYPFAICWEFPGPGWQTLLTFMDTRTEGCTVILLVIFVWQHWDLQEELYLDCIENIAHLMAVIFHVRYYCLRHWTWTSHGPPTRISNVHWLYTSTTNSWYGMVSVVRSSLQSASIRWSVQFEILLSYVHTLCLYQFLLWFSQILSKNNTALPQHMNIS